jgi:Tol biopolymer transport system component
MHERTMSLRPGTRLGAYEITGELGAGGMGEVYRASDTNLPRDVAIKVLPESLADDSDRLARFQREAEVLAALNDTNIAQIYGLERSDDTIALVMELVEGPTLADRIALGPIPADEALGIAMQIANGLQAAHERNIVHRDLKPANIKLRPDGTVKVLDFGIAKALETPRGASGPEVPSLTTPAMTEAGVLLGTAAYMSPEQARGKAVDARTDIWAFGCVLYEMLTGQPAFMGEDVPTTLARVLASDTDMRSIAGAVPPDVRRSIELCLRKNVDERIADIRDVKLALKGAFETGRQASGKNESFGSPLWKRTVLVAAALAVGAVLAGGLTFRSMRASTAMPGPVSRFSIIPPATAPLANRSANDVAISNDGRLLAYFALDQQTMSVELYVRDLDSLDARAIPGTKVSQREAAATSAFFSTDGEWVGFGSPDQGIMRVPLDGEQPLKIADNPSEGPLTGASQATDGSLIYSSSRNLYRVSTSGGGTPEQLTPLVTGEAQQAPVLLPGGRTVLFTLIQGPTVQIAALDLDTREQTILIENASDATYASTGHIIFIRDGTLMAAPFDLSSLTVSGDAVALLPGIRRLGADGLADYALSDNGTLMYVSGGAESPTSALVWVDRDGRVIERAVSDSLDNPRGPRLSPDDLRLVVTTGPTSDNDIWFYNLEEDRPPVPLTSNDDDNFATWSPDGTQIAFLGPRNGTVNIFTAPADGSVVEPKPLRPDGINALPDAWTDAGDLILSLSGDIVATSADGTGDLRDVVATPADEHNAALSPDGRRLAYVTDRTGRPEVWVMAFPDGVSPQRISSNGGDQPVWSKDGQELFYLQGDAMMSVSVETDGGFSFAPAVELFSNPNLLTGNIGGFWSYDVASDGRFLMVQKPASSSKPAEIVVVQNWFEELEPKMQAN